MSEDTRTPDTTVDGDPVYVMARNSAETQRLIDQAAFREPLTRRLFEDAGIAPGMRVLDLGSGAGDVAFLAAEMVGPTGRVLGVDTDPEVLRTARARAEAAGLDHVDFTVGDLRTVDPGERFDAVIGRFVLMYLADPADGLRRVARHLAPGGTLALMEVNWRPESMMAFPSTPLWEQLWTWMCETVEHAGVEKNMGFKLHHAFTEAGLPRPRSTLQAAIADGDDTDAHLYAAHTLRGLMPLMLQYGVATEEEVGIDSLARRLQAETRAAGSILKITDVVGAYTRLPG
ncbi:class I SAM-dependent methyltransferase [Nocardiopsis sp. HNM0947]|uniref:Class I SAM-dependent methyltransferase n=1 Tax=Nocardiopsis coralli TaxID=2772213 RepID=A0ABR9P4A5_9ACTN|nr:class I SAM-dependent methyltransferase [Nocardiopsis coralli]MBE2998666.1 class I SAM-dependent methyltransferase [Nocardiopsis coralli]